MRSLNNTGRHISKWQVVFVLPNINLKCPIETEYVALVQFDDPRVQKLQASHKNITVLTKNFTDQFGRKVHPTVMLCRGDAPQSSRTQEALVGFRNAVAISSIINGWIIRLAVSNTMKPLWSEYFDIYPIYPGRDNDLIPISPAVISGGNPLKAFRGQTSPNLVHTIEILPDDGKGLRELLLNQWKRRYVDGKTASRKTRVLFRSLEVAYQASTTPSYNIASLYDYGTNVGLWVSAIEILAHLYSKKVNVEKVMNLLNKYKWNGKELNSKRYPWHYKGRKRQIRLIQLFYWELYQARNDFFHGNAITHRRLFLSNNTQKPQLIALAPLIYRTALIAYLIAYLSPAPQKGVLAESYDPIGSILIKRALTKVIS
jgi:hypothetical protein